MNHTAMFQPEKSMECMYNNGPMGLEWNGKIPFTGTNIVIAGLRAVHHSPVWYCYYKETRCTASYVKAQRVQYGRNEHVSGLLGYIFYPYFIIYSFYFFLVTDISIQSQQNLNHKSI